VGRPVAEAGGPFHGFSAPFKDAFVNSVRTRLLAIALEVMVAFAAVTLGFLASGQTAYVVTHGVSMQPKYHQGDLVVVTKSSSYHVGEIVAYRAPGGRLVVLHRIVGGNAAGFVMKGDNNQSIDPTKPTPSQILGRAMLLLPQGGLWLQRLTSPVVLALAALGIVAGGGTAASTRRRRKKGRRSMSRGTTVRGTTGRSVAPHSKLATLRESMTPAWRTAAGLTAGVGVLGVLIAGVGWSTSTDTTSRATTTTSRAITFSYSATVPQSPAYDGTKVSFPDPIFRRLANSVDVYYAYHGTPASVTLAARLSTTNGWNVTVPLEVARSSTGGGAHLGLDAIDARTKAAAEATGISQTQVAVSVVATVHSAGERDFTAALPFTLSALQLTPTASSAKSLTMKDSTSVAHPTHVSRAIHVAGHAISIRTLRYTGLALLLLAALGAAALAFLARRPVSSEAERIRRRYARLLLPVEPLVQATGHRIIDVTDFTTLARLAERYELLVLHWNRSGIETFVVQDDSVTYRYRVSGDGARVAVGDVPTAPITSRPNAESVAGEAKSVNQT
jgi:signal peptidase I